MVELLKFLKLYGKGRDSARVTVLALLAWVAWKVDKVEAEVNAANNRLAVLEWRLAGPPTSEPSRAAARVSYDAARRHLTPEMAWRHGSQFGNATNQP